MKNRILILIGLVLSYSFFLMIKSDDNQVKDNYYQAINENLFLDNKLKDDEYSWSYFKEAQDNVDNKVNSIVDDILNKKVDVLSDKQISVIKNVYNKSIDMNKRDADGLSNLNYYLSKTWNVSSVSELVDVIVLIEHELGIGLISNVEVSSDYRDNSKNIIYFVPITYAFGASSDYMVNDDYMSYKAYVRRACVQLWKAYGYEALEAREVVDRVFSFYEGVSNASKLSDELASVSDYYNLVDEKEVNGIFSNVYGEYLDRLGLGGKDIYSIVDIGQYQYLNDSLNIDNLDVWKEVIVTKILSSYANYLSSNYVEIVYNLNNAILGTSEDKSNDEHAGKLVSSLFSSEIDKVYNNKFLDKNSVDEVKDIFNEIKKVFTNRLINNKWLSDTAKDKALAKLDNMKLNIGLENITSYEISNDLEISKNSLVSDVIKMQQLLRINNLKKLETGDKINLVSQTQVNAYYQLSDNSIVIPVAFFELVNNYDNYYEKLGTMGMIIAHEVTHAFDGNGSKFDQNGNLNDWWSSDDKETFEQLKDKVINYYNKYEVLDGKYINGEKTVNENIADLGAVACIVDILKNKNASENEFKIMFEALANIWGSLESDTYMRLLLLQDVHSPNEFRVNAVLSSCEEFYRVYNIYPWNEMWINKNDRVEVW